MLSTLGKIVRKHRIDNEMKLGELASALNISAAHMSSIESGRRRATQEILDGIIVLFKLSAKQADELEMAAIASQEEYRLSMSGQSEVANAAAAGFARALQKNALSDKAAKEILDVLMKQ